MKTQQMIQELQDVARQFGLRVRVEKGTFRGGRCVVEGEQLVVLNKVHPPEVHFAILADCLRDLPLETVFMTPAVREAVEQTWSRRAIPDDSLFNSETE